MIDLQSIERVVSEIHLGYNEDYSKSFFVGLIRLQNGDLQTAHSTHDVAEGEVSWSIDYPTVAHPKKGN